MTMSVLTDPEVATLAISTRSGEVVVWARPIARPEVVGGLAEIQPDGTVRSCGGRRVEIACPEGTDVTLDSSSGRVECHGPLGHVAVTGYSGRITIDAAQTVDVRSAAGAVSVRQCADECRVVAGSGSVKVGSAASVDITAASARVEVGAVGVAVVRTASGRVDLALTRAGSADIVDESGRVWVTVPAGANPELHLFSRTGRVQCDVDAGVDGRVAVGSSSGCIKVTQR